MDTKAHCIQSNLSTHNHCTHDGSTHHCRTHNRCTHDGRTYDRRTHNRRTYDGCTYDYSSEDGIWDCEHVLLNKCLASKGRSLTLLPNLIINGPYATGRRAKIVHLRKPPPSKSHHKHEF